MCACGTQKIWHQESVVDCFKCELCGKIRAIHSVDSSQPKLAELKQYFETQPARCGETLVIHNIPLYYSYFAPATTTCSTRLLDTFYNTSQEMPTLGFGFSSCPTALIC